MLLISYLYIISFTLWDITVKGSYSAGLLLEEFISCPLNETNPQEHKIPIFNK